MTYCSACGVLEHAPAADDPPAALAAHLVIDRLDGALCTYRCTVCNSDWIRFRANQLYTGRMPVWQAMSLPHS